MDAVEVEIKSRAQFSDKGASASQKQITTMVSESAFFQTHFPTIITVSDLNVYFSGADFVVTFGEKEDTRDQFGPLAPFYIELATQKSAEDTHIILLAASPNPQDAFQLTQLKQVERITQSAPEFSFV